MNLENLEKIAQWLEAGAPEAVFHMTYGVRQPSCVNLLDDLEDYTIRTGQTGKGACGSVCCIAGAAYLMAHAPEGQLFPSLEDQTYIQDHGWKRVATGALEYLGLKRAGRIMAHDLFDANLAPKDCTPAQAAIATRRLMNGVPATEIWDDL